MVSILVILVFGISLLSCSIQKKSSTNNKGTVQTTTSSSNQGKSESQQDKQKESKDKLTLGNIKAKYTGGVNGKLIDVITYGSTTISDGGYVLVGYLSDGGYYCYDWYNLVTGDKDVLPTFPYNAKLKEIRNENDIVFTTDGVIEPTGAKYFPKTVECCRAQEVLGSDNDFYQTLGEFYLPINQGFDMGIEAHETIRDIKVSLEGVEVLFGLAKGHEVDFYAGGADRPVPHTKTSYNKAKNQFIIEFINTNIGNEFDRSKITEQNRFINSINIKNSGSNTILTVSLKGISKYYTIEYSSLKITTDGFPYLDFNFADNYDAGKYDSDKIEGFFNWVTGIRK